MCVSLETIYVQSSYMLLRIAMNTRGDTWTWKNFPQNEINHSNVHLLNIWFNWINQFYYLFHFNIIFLNNKYLITYTLSVILCSRFCISTFKSFQYLFKQVVRVMQVQWIKTHWRLVKHKHQGNTYYRMNLQNHYTQNGSVSDMN